MGTTRRAVSVGVISTLAMLTKIDAAAALEGEEVTIGAPDAPAHLVEYASATCPHCAQFHAANWERLKHGYVDSGRVRFTLREMATPPAAVALGMFQLARCEAGSPEEYFRRVGIMFERQRQILETETMAGVRDSLLRLGAEWSLNSAQVMACLNDAGGVTRIQRSMQEAASQGITGTPALFAQRAARDGPGFPDPGRYDPHSRGTDGRPVAIILTDAPVSVGGRRGWKGAIGAGANATETRLVRAHLRRSCDFLLHRVCGPH